MKVQIRTGVFETNSSSTHSLTMCTLSDYKSWKAGLLKYKISTREFVDLEQAAQINEEVLINYNETHQTNIKSFDDLPIIDQMDGAVASYQYENIAEDQEWNTFVKFLEMGENTAVSFGYFAIY